MSAYRQLFSEGTIRTTTIKTRVVFSPEADVVLLDDLCGVVAPLTAGALAENGAWSVKLVTRWPMAGLERILDVYEGHRQARRV